MTMAMTKLLPCWLLLVAWSSALASLTLVCLAPSRVDRIHYPEAGPIFEDVRRECERSRTEQASHALQSDASEPSWLQQRCAKQLERRCDRLLEIGEELHTVQFRLSQFIANVRAAVPEARRWLRDEQAELEALSSKQRGLTGSPIYPNAWWLAGLLALSNTAILLALHLLDWHAARSGIRACHGARDIGLPFAVISAINLVVASGVTLIESLMEDKVGFDYNSFCLPGAAFWTSHASLLPGSLLPAVPLALGWHVTRKEHAPRPSPERFRWGVGPYVEFLERWVFAGTLLTGIIATIWVQRLAADASQTNSIEALLGLGALVVYLTVIWRLIRNALLIRRRCESILDHRRDRNSLPPDPTTSFLGNGLKAPAALVAAFAIAYQWLTWAGVAKLIDAAR